MQEYEEFSNGLKHTLGNVSVTYLQNFFGLTVHVSIKGCVFGLTKDDIFGWIFWSSTYPATKTNTRNHSKWMLKEKHILYFYHSPRLVLSGGISHRHIWINQHTGPKLQRHNFLCQLSALLAFLIPFLSHLSTVTSTLSSLCYAVKSRMDSHCLHGSFWCVPVWLSGVVLTGEGKAAGLCQTSSSVLPL